MTDRSRSHRIAIIGLPSLISYAIGEILNDLSGRYTVETCDTLDKASPSAEFHIISAEVFLRHLQYFMPRKQHIALFTDDRQFPADGILTLSLHDSPSAISSRLAKAISSRTESSTASGDLTPREKDVLCQLASGRTIKEIASELNISVNTVLTHRKNISAKLGVRSVSGLSLYAMMNGMI